MQIKSTIGYWVVLWSFLPPELKGFWGVLHHTLPLGTILVDLLMNNLTTNIKLVILHLFFFTTYVLTYIFILIFWGPIYPFVKLDNILDFIAILVMYLFSTSVFFAAQFLIWLKVALVQRIACKSSSELSQKDTNSL